ncbi:PilZ domain-containing protein [Thiomicrospira sp.]|uniref:PilZ domain-containing protein n=1 Tax=Thiomicrospira sp. TaxID=935 RepID=UPI002F949DE1
MSSSTLDSRRFFRLDMPVYAHIMPRNRIPGCDFFATPAIYLTKQQQAQADAKLIEAKDWLAKVREDTDLAGVVLNDIVKRIAFFNHVMQSVQLGRAPFKLDDYGRNLSLAKAENAHLETYKVSSPKSYAFFKGIENKIKTYLNEIHYMAQNSDSREIRYRNLLYAMPSQADQNLTILNNPKFDGLALPQFIRTLTEYVNLNLNTFLAFQRDSVLKRFPTQWEATRVNLSEGGIRIEQPKALKPGESVCVAFYTDHYSSVIGIKGSVVACDPVAKTSDYCLRINFDFPDRAQQMLIQKIMNHFEINQCVDWIANAG